MNIETLIRHCWHPIGFRSEFEKPNSFVMAHFGKTLMPVAWKDPSHDGVMVFDNICPHRGARIVRPQPRGISTLTCPYHGAVFREGCFHLGDAKLDPRYLDSEWCGDLLFASVDPIRSLQEQLTVSLYDALATLSECIGARHSEEAQVWDCDWRSAVENAIEALHVPLVHRTSLGALGLTNPCELAFGDNSLFEAALSDQRIKRLPFPQTAGLEDRYSSIFLFPFSQLSTTCGYAFSLNRWTPSPDGLTTGFETRLYEGSAKMSSAAGAVYLDAARRTDDQIFGEDREICERLEPGFVGQPGPSEQQIGWFREALGRVG